MIKNLSNFGTKLPYFSFYKTVSSITSLSFYSSLFNNYLNLIMIVIWQFHHPENINCHPVIEVKQRCFRSIVGWVTTGGAFNFHFVSSLLKPTDNKVSVVQLVAKKTGTVRIKLTHFCNFSIV
jgi:hypothetical protein